MGAAATAATGAGKTYLGICIALAVVGGPALAVQGAGFMSESVGTGAGAGVGSLPEGADAFREAMAGAKGNNTPPPAQDGPVAPGITLQR